MQNKTGKTMLGGAVYVLPNLLTSGNLFFGFLCMIRALEGKFGWAAVAIFIAALFDMLDGRVARLTKGTSEFGVQSDSDDCTFARCGIDFATSSCVEKTPSGPAEIIDISFSETLYASFLSH